MRPPPAPSLVRRGASWRTLAVVGVFACTAARAEGPPQPVLLGPRATFARHVVGGEPSAGMGRERLIYSNTEGRYAVNIGMNLVSDDIATTAGPGCRLRRVEFPVVGRVNPADTGGPFTVQFGLYPTCPGSVPGAAVVIPGTAGQVGFADDAPRLVSFAIPDGVTIPSNVWFGVRFSRGNAGVVVGASPFTGMSCDQLDYPGFPCSGSLAGFPEQPHGSFNLELYGDEECGASFVGYKNSRPSGGFFNPGQGLTLVDDIRLGIPNCEMIGYEVAVRGLGSFQFDMRRFCEGSILAGSEKVYNGTGNGLQIARFAVNPPVVLPRDFFFATEVNTSEAGIVTTGVQACVGSTEDAYLVAGETGCAEISAPDPVLHDAVDLTILCAGEPPLGACCDMYFRDENNEAVCRELPQMNCPFPPRSSPEFRPRWVAGAACDPDSFTPFECGKAACCTENACENLTENECNAVPPLDAPRDWQIGRACGMAGQHCVIVDCLFATGDCRVPHATPGCDDPYCCDRVCRSHGSVGAYCCEIEWDSLCVEFINEGACELFPANDSCAPDENGSGASLLTLSNGFTTALTSASLTTEDVSDPSLGCYLNSPGAQGWQTVWYKFVAQFDATRVTTCSSNSPANDSLLALYAVGDMTSPETQCATLIPVGCSDDVAGCGPLGKNSSICAETIPGEFYYIQVASKAPITTDGGFRVTITHPTSCPRSNDFCPQAAPIADGVTPFSFFPIFTLDAPTTCLASMTADMWFDYTATCSGGLRIDTCGESAETSPDTNLAVYGDCLCPPVAGAPLACSKDGGGECGLGAQVFLDVVMGDCYKIRLGNSLWNLPEGNLTITCTQDVCPRGLVQWVTPPGDVVDARWAHPPGNAQQAEGMRTVAVALPGGALPKCLSVCETASEGGGVNAVQQVVEDPMGSYDITLVRPITANAKTTITYRDVNEREWHLRLSAHPGNVNADEYGNEQDALDLLGALEGRFALPFGEYSGDINRSGATTAADLLALIDVFNECPECPAVPNPMDDPGCP